MGRSSLPVRLRGRVLLATAAAATPVPLTDGFVLR